MKIITFAFSTIFLLISFAAHSQNNKRNRQPSNKLPRDVSLKGTKTSSSIKVETNELQEANEVNDQDYGWSKRFSFIAGGGVSIVANKLYNDPVINKTNNAVIIEEAFRIKPNLTLGIVYTPKVSTITRIVKVKEGKELKKVTLLEYYPRGWSFALFMNPVSISKIGESSFANTIDLGLGVGYRSGNFLVLGTAEFFAIRQSKNYFINQFKGNQSPYIVNGEVQTAIDVNDNSIFGTRVGYSIGIKLAYTFDVVKSFYSNSTQGN